MENKLEPKMEMFPKIISNNVRVVFTERDANSISKNFISFLFH